MIDILSATKANLILLGDTSGAIVAMREYVAPTVYMLAGLASLACVFFVMNAGYLYMTSSGIPERMDRAKHVLKNALLGLLIVLAAGTLTSLLSNAYGSPHGDTSAALPSLQSVTPNQTSSGLVDVLIGAVTGFLNTIIQAVAAPVLAALSFFTTSTPLPGRVHAAARRPGVQGAVARRED